MPSTRLAITQSAPAGGTVVFDLQGDSTLTRDSGGGWQIVDRPRRQASTEWLDYGPFTLTLPLLLDGTITGGPGFNPAMPVPMLLANGWQSIEWAASLIDTWQEPAGLETPRLTVVGPVPHSDLTWVCKSVTWNEAIRDNATGERVQQKLSLVLLEYCPPVVALSQSPAAAAAAAQAAAAAAKGPGAPPAPSARTYTVRAGDTLSAIAVRFFGNYRRYIDIAALNGIRDPNYITVGQVLRLPAS